MSRVKAAFENFAREDGAKLPLPGSGDTWRRFEVLASCAAKDLSVGRLAEGHVDALAILAEAGVSPQREHATYGVWAARSRGAETMATPVQGGWRLSGRKSFCSGSGMIQRALVTADAPDGYRMFDIDINDHVTSTCPGSWPAVGMADSASETLVFNGHIVPNTQVVGSPGFYTERPGFWFGAAGVAACWYGGAVGLVNNLIKSLDPEPGEHVLTDVGLAVSRVGAMRDVLKSTAHGIDADPEDARGQARLRALAARQTVHDSSIEVLNRIAAAGGARPLCHDRDQGQRAADLFVYLAQHHGAADAAELGRLALRGRSWG